MFELLQLAYRLFDGGGLAGHAGVLALAVLGLGLVACWNPRSLVRLLGADGAAGVRTARIGPLLGGEEAPSRRADHRVGVRRRHQPRAPNRGSS
jgi:hypothetical protein